MDPEDVCADPSHPNRTVAPAIVFPIDSGMTARESSNRLESREPADFCQVHFCPVRP